jgi:hypothetical protein
VEVSHDGAGNGRMEPLARRTGAQNMDGLYREKAIDRQLGSGSGADGLEIVTRTVVDARITINFRRTFLTTSLTHASRVDRGREGMQLHV